jgi:2,5-diketo-D-gluconate reductase B
LIVKLKIELDKIMYQKLSKSGTDIPSLGLGTWDLKQSECSRVVSEALDLGYRHIDAAAMYENESEVGAGIIDSRVDRAELFLATKINTLGWTP